MNENLGFFLPLAAFVCGGFYYVYRKIDGIGKRLLKIESREKIQVGKDKSRIENITEESSKRLEEITDLKELREHVQKLKNSDKFIASCLKSIDFEIDYQERIFFRELGEEAYRKMESKKANQA